MVAAAPAAPPDVTPWLPLVVAALLVGCIWRYRRQFRPGYATAAVGFLALIYAVIALFAPKPNVPFAIAAIFVAFVLMVVEIQSIANDAEKRDQRHDQIISQFRDVNLGISEAIRLVGMAAAAGKNSLRQQILRMSADLITYANEREIGRPYSVFNYPLVAAPAFKTGPTTVIQSPFEQIKYDGQTTEFYNDRFPAKIDLLLNEAAKMGGHYNGPLYRGTYMDTATIRLIAYALERLTESLGDE